MLTIILLIFAFVLFVVAAMVGLAEPWNRRLVCLGLACWVAAEIVARAGGVLIK